MDGLHVASIVKHRYDFFRITHGENERCSEREDAGSSGIGVVSSSDRCRTRGWGRPAQYCISTVGAPLEKGTHPTLVPSSILS